MKNISITIILWFLSFSFSFSNGIGIIDGTNGVYLKTISTNTVVNVRDQIAITTTTQILINTTATDVNFKYGYPLNEDANPIKLRWKYNNNWNEATISSLPQDNSIPGGGSSGSGTTEQSLQDFLGSNPLFFTPNDTIGIDSTITLEITYVELLPYFLGKVTYHHSNNISALQSEIIDNQTMSFFLESEKEVLNIELLDLNFNSEIIANTTVLTFERTESIGDFNFTVEYELSSEALGVISLSTMIPDSLFNCDSLGTGYFAFIVEPESNVDTEVIEKNFSLIIDRSGSMSGDKIIQAKDAATYIVQNLNFGDFFNIIDFSSDVTSLSENLLEYNIENEALALAYIDNIEAGGSTNISESLITSINQFAVVDESKANIIIFCTDGNATAGEQSTNGILDLVKDEVNSTEKNVFLFTIGIGEDLDQGLLTLLARENDGIVQFVEPSTLQEDLVNFFLSINNPVLLNTSITFSPDVIKEIYPFPYPNLYKGQQLVLSGRYENASDLEVVLEGQAFNVPVNFNFPISLADSTNNNLSFLPKLWAKQKLDALSLDFYLADSQVVQDSISSLIDSLSSCYGVIAVEFSSFDDTTTEVDNLLETIDATSVTYYPNPITNSVTIDFKDRVTDSQNAYVRILNSKLQELIQLDARIHNGKILIRNLEFLQSGIYFVIISIESKQYIVKIVK